MCARTFGLESMIYRLAGDLDSVFAPIVPDAPDAAAQYHKAAEEFAIECNIVKVIGSETYSAMTDEAIQIHGGYGYTEEFPVARAWRDQRLLRIGEGANEIVRVAIVNLLQRREKAGRLPLKDAGLRAVSALTRMESPEPPFHENPLEEIGAFARDAKELAHFLLFQAQERLGAELLEAQEIAAALADILCAAYALESVWLRVCKLQNRSLARWEVILLSAQIAAIDYADEALKAARYALDCLPALDDVVDWRDEPFNGLTSLLARLARREENPMLLRRRLAARVLDAESYPL